MLVPTIPFEYARLVDTTDRVRRTTAHPGDARVRRPPTRRRSR
jgi:hypothetical protein